MLMTSAVAIFFSCSGATGFSALEFSTPRGSDLLLIPNCYDPAMQTQTSDNFDGSSLRRLCLVFLLGNGVIYFHPAPGTKRAQNLVTSSNDFVTLLQAVNDFNIAGSGDAGADRYELRLSVADDDNSLNVLLGILLLEGVLRSRGSCVHGPGRRFF